MTASVNPAASARPAQADLLGIPETTIIALFGPVRAAHLRAPAANTDQDMQLYNRRNKVVAALASRGRHAPVDFAPDIIFYSFQQDHHAMLRSPALTERKLEDWAYGFGRWSIPQADDPCNGSDFQNMLLLASKCETDLTAALQASALVSGVPIRPSLRREINNLMVRFSEFRHVQVERMVGAGLAIDTLIPMHAHFRTIQTTFAHDYRSLPEFLQQLDTVVYAQAMTQATPATQEDHATRAWVGFYRAFFQGLRGGAAPGSLTQLGSRPAAAPCGPRNALMTSPPPASQSPYPFAFDPSIYSTVSSALRPDSAYATALSALSGHTPIHAPSSALAGAASLRTLDGTGAGAATIQDEWARQVWAGVRQPGAFLGPGNGSVNGIDLADDADRRLLFAHQVRDGSREPGHLVQTPSPALAPLPPLAPSQRHAPPYQSARTNQSAKPAAADSSELVVPYSGAMLGSFTPYRELRPPVACHECGAPRAHFAMECPSRFVRVLGETPPGWSVDGRTATKNPAQWDRDELTAEARSDYRRFITTHRLQPHRLYQVTLDDLAGPAPPPLRRAPGGRGK